MPELASLRFEADDAAFAAGPAQEAAIGQLPAAARVERALIEENAPGRSFRHLGGEGEHVRVVEAVMAGHAGDVLRLEPADTAP